MAGTPSHSHTHAQADAQAHAHAHAVTHADVFWGSPGPLEQQRRAAASAALGTDLAECATVRRPRPHGRVLPTSPTSPASPASPTSPLAARLDATPSRHHNHHNHHNHQQMHQQQQQQQLWYTYDDGAVRIRLPHLSHPTPASGKRPLPPDWLADDPEARRRALAETPRRRLHDKENCDPARTPLAGKLDGKLDGGQEDGQQDRRDAEAAAARVLVAAYRAHRQRKQRRAAALEREAVARIRTRAAVQVVERRRALVLAARRLEREQLARQAAAAGRVQAAWRGRVARRRMQLLHASASRIQAAWRRFRRARQQQQQQQQQAATQWLAASRLQRWWRALCRRRLQRAQTSAAAARQRQQTEHDAATRLQAWARGRQARRAYLAARSAATTIQQHWRRRQSRRASVPPARDAQADAQASQEPPTHLPQPAHGPTPSQQLAASLDEKKRQLDAIRRRKLELSQQLQAQSLARPGSGGSPASLLPVRIPTPTPTPAYPGLPATRSSLRQAVTTPLVPMTRQPRQLPQPSQPQLQPQPITAIPTARLDALTKKNTALNAQRAVRLTVQTVEKVGDPPPSPTTKLIERMEDRARTSAPRTFVAPPVSPAAPSARRRLVWATDLIDVLGSPDPPARTRTRVANDQSSSSLSSVAATPTPLTPSKPCLKPPPPPPHTGGSDRMQAAPAPPSMDTLVSMLPMFAAPAVLDDVVIQRVTYVAPPPPPPLPPPPQLPPQTQGRTLKRKLLSQGPGTLTPALAPASAPAAGAKRVKPTPSAQPQPRPRK